MRRLLVPLLFLLLLIPPLSVNASPGWLQGFPYRIPITISSQNAISGYQIPVVIDTSSLIRLGRMKPDLSDIRFTDSDGVTLLPYWIQPGSYPDAKNKTKIWVKIPSIPAGTKTIYMYYGNPSASSMSDGRNVFDFFDDFNTLDTGKWKVFESCLIYLFGFPLRISGYNKIYAKNGTLVIDFLGPGSGAFIYPTSSLPSGSYILQARMKRVYRGSDASVGPFIGFTNNTQNVSSWWATNFLTFVGSGLLQLRGSSKSHSIYVPYASPLSNYNTLTSASLTVWYRFAPPSSSVKNDTVSVSVNGNSVGSFTAKDPWSEQSYTFDVTKYVKVGATNTITYSGSATDITESDLVVYHTPYPWASPDGRWDTAPIHSVAIPWFLAYASLYSGSLGDLAVGDTALQVLSFGSGGGFRNDTWYTVQLWYLQGVFLGAIFYRESDGYKVAPYLKLFNLSFIPPEEEFRRVGGNNTVMLQVLAPVVPPSYPVLGAYEDKDMTHAYFDYVFLRKWVYPEPSVSVGQEQFIFPMSFGRTEYTYSYRGIYNVTVFIIGRPNVNFWWRERNYTADRMEQVNSTCWKYVKVLRDLPAGNYSVTLYVWNSTASVKLMIPITIRKAVPRMNLSVTDAPWFNVTVNATVMRGGDKDVSYAVYMNGTLVGKQGNYTLQKPSGVYNVSFVASGGQNYTAFSVSRVINVYQAWERTSNIQANASYKYDYGLSDVPVIAYYKLREVNTTVYVGRPFYVWVSVDARNVDEHLQQTFTNISVANITFIPKLAYGQRYQYEGYAHSVVVYEKNKTMQTGRAVYVLTVNSSLAGNFPIVYQLPKPPMWENRTSYYITVDKKTTGFVFDPNNLTLNISTAFSYSSLEPGDHIIELSYFVPPSIALPSISWIWLLILFIIIAVIILIIWLYKRYKEGRKIPWLKS